MSGPQHPQSCTFFLFVNKGLAETILIMSLAVEVLSRAGGLGVGSKIVPKPLAATKAHQRHKSPAASNIGPWDGVVGSTHQILIHGGNPPKQLISETALLQFSSLMDHQGSTDDPSSLSDSVKMIFSENSRYKNPPNTSTNRISKKDGAVSFSRSSMDEAPTSIVVDHGSDSIIQPALSPRETFKCAEISFRLNWRPASSHAKKRKEFRGRST